MSRQVDLIVPADLTQRLRIDCAKCSGLCCVALYCAKTDGFPADKTAGTPCRHLRPDFRCEIHPQLAQAQMRGCLAYDCFGAGQLVTQQCYPGRTWQSDPELDHEMFSVFQVVFQLHQMLWYLTDAMTAVSEGPLVSALEDLMAQTQQMTALPPGAMLGLDLEAHRSQVNRLLKQVISHITPTSARGGQKKDYFGKDFKQADLDGRDFSMALMIAANLEGCRRGTANFLGADLRDANLNSTDLSRCLFLTQMQLNSAKGNANTKLPARLTRPASW